MKYKYDYLISFGLNEPFDLEGIKRYCYQNPNKKVLVEVQNTKGISSDMIRQLGPNVAFRIAGGYDTNRINRFGVEIHLRTNYYFDAVVYSRRETVMILEEIEKIESELNNNWSDIQKLIFIYDKLKRDIMYDPKYEKKASSEIRSLRGFISKQTVCAGYAMMLKEILDRNNISCEYVEGHTSVKSDGTRTGGHAWNIVNIEGKKYPIDLTWDNSMFRSGKRNTSDWLGRDVNEFSRHHMPFRGEKTQNYRTTLSQIKPEVVESIKRQIGITRATDYRTTTYYGTRKDGSRFIISQLGDAEIDGVKYYRYYFCEVNPDNSKRSPLILVSETNVTHLVDAKQFGEKIPPNYEETVDNILFSRANIADSLAKGTCYIGKVKKSKNSNKVDLVKSPAEIEKPTYKNHLFNYEYKVIKRSNGTVIIAQKMTDKPFNARGYGIYRFDLFEMVKENGKDVLKRNTIFTEVDFFKDNRKGIADDYLSRDRLDRKVQEAGGYIGYYSPSNTEVGFRTYNTELVEYFKTSKRTDIQREEKRLAQVPHVEIPSFEEIRELALQYYIDFDFETPNQYKVVDRNTGIVVVDRQLRDKAIFANVWLGSAGIKRGYDEQLPGENYAFNSQAHGLYNYICKELLSECRQNGVIDPVEIFKNVDSKIPYKHNREIVVRLFRSPEQVEIINRMFLQSIGVKNQMITPEPLLSQSHAVDLANGVNSRKAM